MPNPVKICIVGSGNWGSVIAKVVGLNVQGKPAFAETVKMYVYEEIVNGRKLTEIINTEHENVKYLPGCKIPPNVRRLFRRSTQTRIFQLASGSLPMGHISERLAVPDIAESAADADILIFVTPHQFIRGLCKQLDGHVKKSAIGVSLVKGVDVTDGRLDLISNVIRNLLGINCAVLMGANIASEVALEQFCEATIGCKDLELGKLLKEIFQTPYFRITVVPDVETVELCGALKNIVAVGAGFIDGLKYGGNTKAAVIRLGFMEMVAFSNKFFDKGRTETFLESCGFADLITTCYSGRNRRIAEVFVTEKGQKSIEQLENELLNGQKLQGPPTAAEVNHILKKTNLEDQYPLFTAIHRICTQQLAPEKLIECLQNHPEHI